MDTCGNENEGLFTYVAIEGAGYGGTPTPASGASATAMATDGAVSKLRFAMERVWNANVWLFCRCLR